MKIIAFIFFLIYTLSLSFTIRITDIPHEKAPLYLLVFDDPRGFPEDAGKSIFSWTGSSLEASQGISTGLREGIYAIAVFQDVDLNGKLSKRFYGAPREPFGVSGVTSRPMAPPTFKGSSIYIHSWETLEIPLWNY